MSLEPVSMVIGAPAWFRFCAFMNAPTSPYTLAMAAAMAVSVLALDVET